MLTMLAFIISDLRLSQLWKGTWKRPERVHIKATVENERIDGCKGLHEKAFTDM